MVPAVSLTGRVELPSGQTLPREPKSASAATRPGTWHPWKSVPDGRFTATGLVPETYELRFPIKGFAIDPEALGYQTLSDQSFGIRITESIDDLHVPLAPCRRRNESKW